MTIETFLLFLAFIIVSILAFYVNARTYESAFIKWITFYGGIASMIIGLGILLIEFIKLFS